ncbi:DUF5895 domain-containing protein [Pleurocapsa sp. PCC 7319]|uniref:DUF5895 domain-containing protein n=1 Tax=Pleurocapsa sp. PCC 7319 TaxID=118161 RepID=UPI00034D74D6|nr:DUF5895 domain-containing protein [Pleurocapsa sp. PCC 7319]
MNLPTSLLSQFESEVIPSTQLPFCQIQNPPNLSLCQIEQLNPPWGWFIPAQQAELAEFNAVDDWQPTRLTFGEDTSSPRSVDGFLSTHIRIVVLHQSNIEVQEKTAQGWRYLGQAYQHGQLTSYGESAYSDRQNYRLRTRYLVIFLDDDNQLLHSVPFQIGMNAGVGAAFNTELQQFRKEIETIFFAQLGKPVVQSPPVKDNSSKNQPSRPVLWLDFPTTRLRRALSHQLRQQQLVIESISATKPITKQPNQLITRDQRAHRRLSWTQRWSRNSILDTAAHWRVTLFGISSAILDWLGSLKPSPALII